MDAKTIEVLEAMEAVGTALLARGEHEQDSDCTVVNGECIFCLVDHSGQCLLCGGHGYHYPECGEVAEVDEAAHEKRDSINRYGADR